MSAFAQTSISHLPERNQRLEDVSPGRRNANQRNTGDYFFQAKQYARALLWYEAAVKQDSTDWRSTWRAAESLRHLFRYPEALTYYRRIYENDLRHFPDAAFYYALMLKQHQGCERALPLLKRFADAIDTKHPLYEQAHAEQQGCYADIFHSHDSSSLRVTRLPAPLNSPAHDYGAVPYQHDSSLLLTSGRWRTAQRKIDYQTGQNYTNQVLVTKQAKGWNVSRKPTGRWNTAWHDGPGCFNAGHTAFYFTRCQSDYCHIFVSYYRRERWQKPVLLGETINAPRTNSKHPALSGSGDTLFFVSDRPNGYGGSDLWMSQRDSSGWGVARNLGETINTPLDEIAPSYYRQEDLFFFASRGHGSRGGMDIYGVPDFALAQGTLPYRLPPPINSSQDDCFLTMGERQGFFSSNRGDSFDIYRFTPRRTFSLTHQLFGRAGSPASTNRKPVLMHSDKVLHYDVPLTSKTNDIVVVRSIQEERLSNGSSRFILNSNVNDIALRRLREQRGSTQPVVRTNESTSSPSTTFTYRADSISIASVETDFIPPSRRGEVMGTVYHAKEGRIIPTARTEVHLLDSTGNVVKITTTNEIGRFHFVNLSPGTRYSLALSETPSTVSSAYRVQDLVVKEYGEEITTVPYETLYFDFNQPTLRPEAQQALADLAHYFRLNERIAIEINAYTDSLGNDAYNMLLSQQRGESVFDFLLEQGVDRSALVINAQGVSTAIASTNSFVSQQLNRRVEIQLIGEDIDYYPLAETRILRPNVNLKQLYQVEGILEEELSVLNGRNLDQITPLKPLRVPVLKNPALDQFFFSVDYQQ